MTDEATTATDAAPAPAPAKAKKKSSKRAASKPKKVKAKKVTTRPGKYDDADKIEVIAAEHNRREGSRYFTGFEQMRKASTVGKFRTMRGKNKDATELLRAALADKFIRIG